MKWRTISDPAYNVRSWGDEFVVFNTLSGDTHLLGVTAAQILSQLHQTPSTTSALITSLGTLWQVEPNKEFAEQIEPILADLHTLALIEQGA